MTYATSGNVRTREAAVGASAEYTDWVRIDSRQSPNVFTASVIDDSTTLSCVWVVQARRVKNDSTTGNVVTLYTSASASNGGAQTAQLAGVWEVRCGLLTRAAGSAVAAIDW
jgi:hypothetical protein